MANLTQDIKTIRYGSPGNSTQPQNLGMTATVTAYRGSIATTRSGYVVPAYAPQSTDITWGVIDKYGPGYADVGPGVTGGTTNGVVTVEVQTGSFFFQNGTGADAFTATNIGATAYVQNEQTMALTNGSATRPVGGEFLGLASALAPNRPDLVGMIAVKVGPTAGNTGGPS